MNSISSIHDDRYEIKFAPFEPTTNQEEIVAAIVRRMLHFHIFNVQLDNVRNIDRYVARRIRKEQTKARVEGFRMADQAIKAGVRISYDDDMLRREAIDIAYAISRFDTEDALALEEKVVAIAVTYSLYGTEPVSMAIAA